jgi:FKBP-type peptidyl-prolyl cis-trans isomerase (trigger factor)
MARMYGQHPKAIFDIYDKNQQLKESIYNLLFENKIYETLFDSIPSEERVISKKEFDDILKPQQA